MNKLELKQNMITILMLVWGGIGCLLGWAIGTISFDYFPSDLKLICLKIYGAVTLFTMLAGALLSDGIKKSQKVTLKGNRDYGKGQ